MCHELRRLYLALARTASRGWRRWGIRRRLDGDDVDWVWIPVTVAPGRGEDSEGEGRKRDVIEARRGGIRDEERRELPACRG